MREDRALRVLRPSLALTALAAILVLLGLAITGPANAATKSPKPEATKSAKATPTTSAKPSPTSSGAAVLQRGSEVRFGEDVVVAEGTTVPSVGAFGGDVTINGRVTDSVVAFGGDVTINGTVGKTVAAFGGDVKLGPKAVVGESLPPSEAALLLFGGTLTRAPGAQVTGEINTFTGVNGGDFLSWAGRGMIFSPMLGLSFFGWLVQTAFFLVLALVAAALMPRQLRGLQRQLGRKPWASLGWGALAFFVAVPAILVVLVISIIGLLLVLPYGLFVLLAYFFVTTGVGAFLAQRVLTGFGGKENLMLAVVIGVVGTTVVSRIPAVGPILLMAMMVFGAGAAILGVAEWRRQKREAAATLAAANAAAAGVTAATAAPAPQAVITPMVQTSPVQDTQAVEAATAATTAAIAEEPTAAIEPVEPPQAPVGPAEPAPPAELAPAAGAEPAFAEPSEPEADETTAAADPEAAPEQGEQTGPAAT
jgi:hypothetical protein